MNEAQARKIVVAVALVMVAVVFWENLVNRGSLVPPAKTIVVFLVLLTGLSLGASLAPEVFGPLTLLVGTAVAISRVPQTPGVFLSRYAGASKAPTPPPPPSSSIIGGTGGGIVA